MEEVGGELHFLLGYTVWVGYRVTFFITIKLGFRHLWNLLQSWKPHDWEIRKTHNRCILHWSLSILWNWSDFHNLQKWYNMPLKRSWEMLAKLSTNYFKVIFFHHAYGHSSLAFWAWQVVLIDHSHNQYWFYDFKHKISHKCSKYWSASLTYRYSLPTKPIFRL